MNHRFSLLAISILFQYALAAEHWITFTSKQSRFRVEYPSSWYSLQLEGGLDIVNFPPDLRVHGVVLTGDGAELTVLKQPRDIHSLEQWIQADLVDSRPETQREVDAGAVRDGCRKLVEVRWKWEGGPNQYFHETAYYCTAKVNLYRIEVTYWAENLAAPKLDALALRVARSLRVW